MRQIEFEKALEHSFFGHHVAVAGVELQLQVSCWLASFYSRRASWPSFRTESVQKSLFSEIAINTEYMIFSLVRDGELCNALLWCCSFWCAAICLFKRLFLATVLFHDFRIYLLVNAISVIDLIASSLQCIVSFGLWFPNSVSVDIVHIFSFYQKLLPLLQEVHRVASRHLPSLALVGRLRQR